jgi:hypothetical protein
MKGPFRDTHLLICKTCGRTGARPHLMQPKGRGTATIWSPAKRRRPRTLQKIPHGSRPCASVRRGDSTQWHPSSVKH